MTLLLCRVTMAGSFMGLGDLTGGAFESYAYGISDDGKWVVGQATGPNGPEAYRWSLVGGMQPLGDLAGGEFYSSAYDISADGMVLVGHGTTQNGSEAFRWTPGTGLVGLGDLVSPAQNSYATGISSDGKIIVGGATPPVGIERAFRWTEETGMVALGGVETETSKSFAFRISGDGSTIVGEANESAARWNSSGSVSLIQVSGLPQGRSLRAMGVNFDGSRIVGARTVNTSFLEHTQPFRTSTSGRATTLPSFTRSTAPSEASAISDDGLTVVGYTTRVFSATDIFQEAFIWTSADGTRLVRDVLEDFLNIDMAGWRLTTAEAISSDGMTIVGWGTNPDGNVEAWMAVVPEPAGMALLSLFPAFGRSLRRRAAPPI